MMNMYIVEGNKYWYEDGTQPKSAILFVADTKKKTDVVNKQSTPKNKEGVK